jgi:hypothetical protein
MSTRETLAALRLRLLSKACVGLVGLLLLASVTCVRPAFAEQTHNAKACAIPEVDVAGLNGNDGDDAHAVRNYEDTILRLLQKSRFKELDCLADSARSSEEELNGGMWRLHLIYAGLAEARHHDTEFDWQARLGHLNDWATTNPKSITARIALAEAYAMYGWNARGDGYSETVTKNGWTLFEKRMDKAGHILQQAESLRPLCPEWFVAMQEVALGQSWNSEKEKALFDRAVTFAPGYYYIYRQHAFFLLPKWNGKEGDSARFAGDAANQVGGEQGDILYFQIAGLLCFHNNREWATPISLMSWPRIRRGFNAQEKRRGKSYTNLNLLALMATLREDFVVADGTFARIGDQWDENTWQSKSYFDSCRDSAKENAPVQAEIHSREDAAEANVSTPEGTAYQAVFDQRIKELMQPCTEPTEGKPITVELLIRVANNGKIENMVGVGVTNASNCLMKQLAQFRLKDEALFAPPPKPSYWVRKDLPPDTTTPVAKN